MRLPTAAALGALAAARATPALAHGFDERYELPLPLHWVVGAACTVVLLSFVAMVLFARASVRAPAGAAALADRTVRVPRSVQRLLQALGLALFVVTIAAALAGSQDPLMNLAPTLVWVGWWLGLTLVCALLANVWPLLDPWRSSFGALAVLARRCGWSRGAPLRWPAWLGMWPAVALLLVWSWLEVVQPLASSPFKLGVAALAWTAISWAGMATFGRDTWQAHADPFAIYFATLGRMAPLRLGDGSPPLPTAGRVAFVIAMLATVVFDGLHGGAAWLAFEAAWHRVAPHSADPNGLQVGTAGLLLVWAVFWLAYSLALRATLALLRLPAANAAPLAALLATSLVPIAAGYALAHNGATLLTRAPVLVQLLSDPFGRQWDLFGSARWHVDAAFVDARFTWGLALAAIVAGHVLAIVWSHRIVLAAGVAPRRAARALLPLTVLMVAYTAVSLVLIAEPMVVSPAD